MQQKIKNIARKSGKILLGLLLLCVTLVICLFAVTRTDFFKDWLRDKIIAESKPYLTADFSFARLTGNLWSNFRLQDLRLVAGNDTVASLKEVAVNFDPAALFENRVQLKVVSIESPVIRLVQGQDSLWNVTTLMKDTGPPDTSTTPSSWGVALEKMAIRSGRIYIKPLQEQPALPDIIEGIDADISASFQGGGFDLVLDQLKLKMLGPDVQISRLAFSAGMKEKQINLDDLDLILNKTHFQGRAAIAPDGAMTCRIAAAPLHFDDIRAIAPDFPLLGSPEIEFVAGFANDSLDFNIDVTRDGQKIKLTGFVLDPARRPSWQAQMDFDKIDLTTWVADTLDPFFLNGSVQVQGSGNKPDSLQATLKAGLNRSQLAGRSVKNVDLHISAENGEAAMKLDADGPWGSVQASGTVRDILGERTFAIQSRARHIDLMRALQDSAMISDLNLFVQTRGKMPQPDALDMQALIHLSPSHVMTAEIDTAFSHLRIRGNKCSIDTFAIESDFGQFYLGGVVDLATSSDLQFSGTIGDMHWIRAQIQADTLRAQGEFSGHISGQVDQLQSVAHVKLRNISYNALTLAAFTSDIQIQKANDSIQGQIASALVGFANMGVVQIDTSHLAATFKNTAGTAALFFAKDSTYGGTADVKFTLDSVIAIETRDVALSYKDEHWRTVGKSAVIVIDSTRNIISGLELQSNEQSIALNGVLSMENASDIALKVRGLDVANMVRVFNMPPDFSGTLDMDASLLGSLGEPKVATSITIEKGRFSKFTYDEVKVNVESFEKRLGWDLALQRNDDKQLKGEGFVPLNMFPDSGEAYIDPDKDFRFQISTQGLDLSFLEAFTTGIKGIKGRLTCDINVTNTLNNPIPEGSVRVLSGAVKMPLYGAHYQDIQVALQVKDNKINVIQLDVGTERQKGGITGDERTLGRLWVAPGGYIEYDKTGIESGLKEMALKVKANDFVVARSRDFDARLSTDISIQGNLEKPTFGGTLTVTRSSLNLPWLDEIGFYDAGETEAQLDLAEQDTTKIEEIAPEKSNAYMENMTGILKVDIPKNSWIRGPDMNMELSGSLDLIKNGKEFEQPFGSIQIIRGTYDLITGARFEISEGEIGFEGGTEFNPLINMKALHTIRGKDGAQSYVLRLEVSGYIFTPSSRQLNFFLDDEPLETSAAIALLVAGRRGVNALGSGLAADNFGEEEEEKKSAGSFVADFVASQLSQNISKELSLDVLEIKGDDNWEKASIEIGKYLTNKLFLKIQNVVNFGRKDGDEGLVTNVTLEYALQRFLLLQATGGSKEGTQGFDIIWKVIK